MMSCCKLSCCVLSSGGRGDPSLLGMLRPEITCEGGVGSEKELGKGILPYTEVRNPLGLGGLKEGHALVSILKSLSYTGFLARA